MCNFQEILERRVLEYLSDNNIEVDGDVNQGEISQIVSETSSELATGMLEELKNDVLSGCLEDEKEELRQFRERLREHWSKPLGLLELHIRTSLQFGSDFSVEYKKSAETKNDRPWLFEALAKLHARACQISSAILVLLEKGFADDAHARWRSLHEIAVTSAFISMHGPELAEKYLLHEAIQQYKLVREAQLVESRTNEMPVSKSELADLRLVRDNLIGRFGKNFKENYGWAAETLGVNRPTFRTIEKATNLDHFRPYYKMASDNVHAESHGTNFRLGMFFDQHRVLLAGPSNAGLADPGHSTAISLNTVTTSLLGMGESLEVIVMMKLLTKLAREVGESFLEAHNELERMEAALADLTEK